MATTNPSNCPSCGSWNTGFLDWYRTRGFDFHPHAMWEEPARGLIFSCSDCNFRWIDDDATVYLAPQYPSPIGSGVDRVKYPHDSEPQGAEIRNRYDKYDMAVKAYRYVSNDLADYDFNEDSALKFIDRYPAGFKRRAKRKQKIEKGSWWASSVLSSLWTPRPTDWLFYGYFLDARIVGVLHKSSIRTYSDLAKLNARELFDLPGMGSKRLRQLEEWLRREDLIGTLGTLYVEFQNKERWQFNNVELHDYAESSDYNMDELLVRVLARKYSNSLAKDETYFTW